jgi:hypothetical protein
MQNYTVRLIQCSFIAAVLIGTSRLSTAQIRHNNNLLKYGVTGEVSEGSPPELHPQRLLRSIPLQSFLLQLAKKPPFSRSFADSLLGDNGLTTEQLIQCGIVREEQGNIWIDCNLLTKEDIAMILPITKRYAGLLAREYISRRIMFERMLNEYKTVGTLDVHNKERNKVLLFILIGCFSLDWDGLELTAKENLRSRSKTRSNGQYTVWAMEESTNLIFKEYYKGSHSVANDSIVMTTFGDHYSLPRYALPDIFWLNPQKEMVNPLVKDSVKMLFHLVRISDEDTLTKQLLQLCRLCTQSITFEQLLRQTNLSRDQLDARLQFLQILGYIRLVKNTKDMYKLSVPYLRDNDSAVVHKIVFESRKIMSNWLRQHYVPLQQELSALPLSSMRNHVDFRQIFTELWHFLFGYTNQILVKKGLFTDPYGKKYDFKGFVPFLWSKKLETITTMSF